MPRATWPNSPCPNSNPEVHAQAHDSEYDASLEGERLESLISILRQAATRRRDPPRAKPEPSSRHECAPARDAGAGAAGLRLGAAGGRRAVRRLNLVCPKPSISARMCPQPRGETVFGCHLAAFWARLPSAGSAGAPRAATPRATTEVPQLETRTSRAPRIPYQEPSLVDRAFRRLGLAPTRGLILLACVAFFISFGMSAQNSVGNNFQVETLHMTALDRGLHGERPRAAGAVPRPHLRAERGPAGAAPRRGQHPARWPSSTSATRSSPTSGSSSG